MKQILGKQYTLALLLGISLIIFSCHSMGELTREKSSGEIVENEIWDPIIILTRQDKKMITAKSK